MAKRGLRPRRVRQRVRGLRRERAHRRDSSGRRETEAGGPLCGHRRFRLPPAPQSTLRRRTAFRYIAPMLRLWAVGALAVLALAGCRQSGEQVANAAAGSSFKVALLSPDR